MPFAGSWALDSTRHGTTQLPGRIAHSKGLSFIFSGVSPLVVAWHHSIGLRLLISWLLLRFCCFPVNLLSQSANSFASEWDIYHILTFLQDFSPANEVIIFFYSWIPRERVSKKMEKESHWNLGIPGGINYLKRKVRDQWNPEGKPERATSKSIAKTQTTFRFQFKMYSNPGTVYSLKPSNYKTIQMIQKQIK